MQTQPNLPTASAKPESAQDSAAHTPGRKASGKLHIEGGMMDGYDIVDGTTLIAANLWPSTAREIVERYNSYPETARERDQLLEALRELTEWARTYTSALDANSPHEILIRAVNALGGAI